MSDEEIVQRFLAGEGIWTIGRDSLRLEAREAPGREAHATYVQEVIRQRLQALTDSQAGRLARQRARQHKWREAHPGANVQHTLKWQAANKERLNAYRREWRARKKAEKRAAPS